MNRYVYILGVVILVLIGGYFIITSSSGNDEQTNDELTATTVAGEVVSVDLEQVAVDGPALVEIRDAAGEGQVITVPSMGIQLCAAKDNIADPYEIEVGDRVDVRGTLDSDGRVVPCEDEDDYLRVTRDYTDEELGLSFVYPVGKSGYALEDTTEKMASHPDLKRSVMLTDTQELEELQNATEGREGPPTIQVQVFDNTQSLQPSVWIDRNEDISLVEMALTEPEEAVVGGANAVHYTADGLYATDMYVVAHGGYIYLFSGSYIDGDSQIKRDFGDLIGSVTFIPTQE